MAASSRSVFIVDDQLTIEPHTTAIVHLESQSVVFGTSWLNESGPAAGIVIPLVIAHVAAEESSVPSLSLERDLARDLHHGPPT